MPFVPTTAQSACGGFLFPIHLYSSQMCLPSFTLKKHIIVWNIYVYTVYVDSKTYNIIYFIVSFSFLHFFNLFTFLLKYKYFLKIMFVNCLLLPILFYRFDIFPSKFYFFPPTFPFFPIHCFIYFHKLFLISTAFDFTILVCYLIHLTFSVFPV